MLKASRMTGPGSTLGLGLYSNFYSKKAAVEASTAATPCVRAPYPLQPLQPLQPLSSTSISTYSIQPLHHPSVGVRVFLFTASMYSHLEFFAVF